MRRLLLASVALAAFALPANAVVLQANQVGATGTTTIPATTEVNGNPTTIPQVAAQLTLTYEGLSNNGLTWNFDYTLTNVTQAGWTSRISSFGVNTTPNPVSVSATGFFGNEHLPPNGLPGFFGPMDYCASANANGCSGGNGLTNGQTASGELDLTFSSILSSLSLDSAFARFQDINGSLGTLVLVGASGLGLNTNVGINPVIAPVPLPPAGGLFGAALFGLYWLNKRRKKLLSGQFA